MVKPQKHTFPFHEKRQLQRLANALKEKRKRKTKERIVNTEACTSSNEKKIRAEIFD